MLRDLVSSWREARRYAVPPEMVVASAARRAAGDVAGACAAARVDLLVDVAAVRRTHGAEIADRLAGDLRHLAPDLLHWHAPRGPGGQGLLAPRRRITLARYGGDALSALTPRLPNGPQRIQLRFERSDVDDPAAQADRWDLSRRLWDVRAVGELRAGLDRLPFHAPDGRLLDPGELPTERPADSAGLVEWTTALIDGGREAEAWAACGIPIGGLDGDGRFPGAYGLVAVAALRAALVRDLPALHGGTLPDGPVALLRASDDTWQRDTFMAIHHSGGAFTARSARPGPWGRVPDSPTPWDLRARGARDLPLSWYRRSPDLELLRLGRITPEELHPLVRRALFPGLECEYRPRHPPTPPRARVRCRTGWHWAGWQDGRLTALDHVHPPEEIVREQALHALGGRVPDCFTLQRRWRTGGPGKLPKAFRAWRRHAITAVLHGDDREFVRLLDAGVDPVGIGHRDGRAALHLLAHLNRPDLIGRLVAAGLDLHARDVAGRTPLGAALWNGGSAALVRALLDAGAAVDTRDEYGATPLHLLCGTDAAVILPWLLDAGLDLEHTDRYGRTPLLALLAADAPPEPLRALADAGADVHAATPRRRHTVPALIAERRRTDLDFLLAAHGGAG